MKLTEMARLRLARLYRRRGPPAACSSSVGCMAVVLALLAATAFAAGTVLQQRGTLSTPDSAENAQFFVQILGKPVWQAGACLQGLGWVLQAAALDRGSLIVVQALTTLSLVIALPLGVRFTGQHIGRRDVLAALGVVVGIVVFLVLPFCLPEVIPLLLIFFLVLVMSRGPSTECFRNRFSSLCCV